jgi:predicted small metal-binding protein
MKTMTCHQLGGPCEIVHAGDDANEIIKKQDSHLREAVAAGSAEHEPALRDMKGRWRRPISGMKWYRQVQRDFDALPSDARGN